MRQACLGVLSALSFARANRWLALRRYGWAEFLHYTRLPFTPGDPLLGKTPEERGRNIERLVWRHHACAPKPEDYGLTQQDVPR